MEHQGLHKHFLALCNKQLLSSPNPPGQRTGEVDHVVPPFVACLTFPLRCSLELHAIPVARSPRTCSIPARHLAVLSLRQVDAACEGPMAEPLVGLLSLRFVNFRWMSSKVRKTRW